MFTFEFDHLDWHFTVLKWMKTNLKISHFSRFLLRSKYTIQVKFENDWNFLILFHSSRKQLKSSLHLNLIILTAFYSFTVNEDKLLNQSIWSFLLTSRYAILVKIWKWVKLLNTVPFIKKTLVNHVYIWIWSYWLTFTVLKWMKTNFKFSQFSRFLLMSEYTIQVKIWKGIKLLNCFSFMKKTLVNEVYIRIWSSWLTFTVLQWMKRNSKITQSSSFLLMSSYAI